MDWFRSYHGAPTDPKWKVVAKRAGAGATPGHVAAIWFYLEDFASQHADRGSIKGFDAEVLADFYEWPVSTVEAVVKALRAKELINGRHQLTAWMRRQPKREDYSTDRVRRHREKRSGDAEKPPGRNAVKRNGTRNALKRTVTPEQNRTEQRREEQNRKKRLSSGSKPPNTDVQVVFDYWVEKTSRPKATLTNERKAKITARLKRFSVDDLKSAIDGLVLSEFHTSKAEYTELTSCFGNDTKVENHIARAANGKHVATNGHPPEVDEEQAFIDKLQAELR